MAKKKEVVITCNATNVKAVIEGLERGMAALAKEEEHLLNVIKQRGYAENDEKKRLKELEKAMDAMRTNVQKNRDEMKKYGEVMKDLAGAKTKELKKALQEAKTALNNMSAKDPGRQKLINDMKRIQQQIDANTGSIKKFGAANGSVWQTAVRNITAYVGVMAGFNKLKSLVEGVYTANLKLSDSLANIRKVSGLSGEAINQLYRNISKIDSRNTIEVLNELAYTGAKLGIGQNYGVQGLTGFVKAAEQVQMALGEDMGEKALPELAKMTEVMGLIEKYGVEQSMQKAASAIFQLGATSTATGTNIVEFSKRLYGLANVSRVTSDELLAIGSASDAMGLMPEVAATAFNKLFTAVQKNHNMIEKTLNLQPGLIKNYYTQGKTMEAIVAIFEKMNETGNLNLLGNVFKDLGSDGARLVNVMATMSDRVDILKKHLETSREAFKEGEAVIGEYMIQNQTAQAMMERASNLWAKAFTNPEGVDMVKELAQAWYDVSKSLTQSEAMMGSLHSTISALSSAIAILIRMMPSLIRLGFIMATAFGFKAAIAGVGSLITGLRTLYTNVMAANGALGAMNVLLKSNAFLVAASAIATVVTLMLDYGKAADEAAKRETERQAKLKAGFENSKEAVENCIKPLETYKRTLDKANLSEQQKLQLVKDFKNDYQDYLDYLGIEVNTALDLAKAYGLVVKVMKQKKAYEERESYRTEQNGQNRMDRIAAQAQAESEARSLGIEGVNKTYLEGTQNISRNGYKIRQGSDAVVLDILRKKYGNNIGMSARGQVYRIETIDENAPVSANNQRITNIDVDVSGLRNAVRSFVSSYRTETNINKQIDDMFNAEYADIDLANFNIDDFNQKVQEARWKRKGTLDNEKPDKDALRAARKAAQEAKQAARKDLKDAQEASTGILSKLEEYYRLQETAIQEARADGQLTEDQAKEMVRSLNIFKNESLATARRAIVSGDTKQWDRMKHTILPAVLADTSEVSRDLLSTIQGVMVDKLHSDLARFNGDDKIFGLSSRAFFDQIRAKAAGNEREAARLRAKIQNEVEKALLQYQFVEKANQQMRKDVENMGITTETYEQWAKRMQEGIDEKPDTRITIGQNAQKQITQQFAWDWERRMQQPSRLFNGEWNPQSFPFNSDQDEQVQEWFRQFASNAEWAAGIPKIGEWLKDGEKYKAEIRKFYESLILIQESAMQKSENVSPLAPVDNEWLQQGQQGLNELFSRTISDEQAYRQMGNKFMDMGVINFRYNIDNEEEAREWIKQFATDARGDLEGWAQAFPELANWIDLIKRKEQGETLGEAEQKALEQAMPSIRNLFREMMNHADRIDKAMKDAFQHEKSQQESRFRIAGYKDQEEQTDKYYSNKTKQEETGAGQNFAQMLGLGSIAEDPEILQIQNRIYWRNQEVIEAQKRLDALKAQQDEEIAKLRETAAAKEEIDALEKQHAQDRAGLEQLLADRQTALSEQTSALATKTMQELQKRVSAVQGIVKPFSDAANSIGKKLGDMIRGAEEDSITWNEIWKNMLLAVAESVIQMGAQYAENLVMQQSMNRASEAETMAHTTTEVTAGIAAGSAKTIGTLGWWGIPLIAVISALLMGLLQAALSTSNNNTTAAKPKTKLTSGMLTYDEGNVQTVVGDDGHVYRARSQKSLPEGVGIVKSPIATNVNGQQALVGERGPEIVIGRKTTRALMMNRPDILQALNTVDRGITTRRVRTFDEGNISDLASVMQSALPQMPPAESQSPATESAERDAMLVQTMQQMLPLMQGMVHLLENPVAPEIAMYGENGLHKKMKKADQFYARYGD